jgi:hypothetical protein
MQLRRNGGHMKYKHIAGVGVIALFSADNHYRYRLEILKHGIQAPWKTVCVVMQNPSYANETEADKSVQFLETLIFEKGLPEFERAGRLIIVNQFGRVQTKDFKGANEDIGIGNDAAIEASLRESEIIILGWGSTNLFDVRKCFVLNLLKQMSGKQIFNTKSHPSRGCYDGFIQPYSV